MFLSSQMSQLDPHLYPPKPKEGFTVVTNGREGLLHEVSPPGVLRKTDATQGNTAPQGSNRILTPPSWGLTPPSPWVSPVAAMVRVLLAWRVARKKRLYPSRHIWIIRLLSFGEIT